MLAISEAASEPPGDRQTKVLDSFVCSVHFGGTVHEMPSRSHFISFPPARAAVCSAVGRPGSAVFALAELEFDDEAEDECAFFSRSDRLQSESANPISRTSRMFFIRRASIRKPPESQLGPQSGPKAQFVNFVLLCGLICVVLKTNCGYPMCLPF